MKKRVIIIFLVMIAICSIVLSYNNHTETENMSEDNIESDSNFVYDEIQTETYIENEYDGSIDGLEPAAYALEFSNPEILYDMLTLEALSHIYDDVGTYLNQHGYADCRTLTIIKSSVINDKSYPRFVCTIDELTDKYLEIRYNLKNETFELQIVTEY